MKSKFLAFGLLGSALADNVLDTADEQLPFSNANSLETNIGTSTIVKHSTNAGEFDVTSTIVAGSDYYAAIGINTPSLGLDIGDDTGNIGAGVVLKWSEDPCGTAGQTFADISTKVPIGDPQECKVSNVAVDNLNLCDIGYTGGNGADWVASGCIKFDRDIKYYGHSQRTIQFYDTYLNNAAATNPYTGASGAVSMKESWKFDLSSMAFTAKDGLGPVSPATVTGNTGIATVTVDFKIRVGNSTDVFGDCTDALEGSPKTLTIEHQGGMIAAFDDFHSDWKNGQTLGLSSSINSQVSSGTYNAAAGDNKCKITYSGTVVRQFPINDMHAAYYQPVACAGANCEQALRFTYDATTGGSWDADAIHYLSGPTSISKASEPVAVADAQAEVNGVGWLADIPLVKTNAHGLFQNVADLTSDPSDASDLLQTITFTAVPGTSGCATHSSELYKLSISEITNFHSSRERQCLVDYPDPDTKYNIPSTFTFAGVESQPYEPNILQGSASDSAWDYGAFGVTGSDSELITISYTPSNVKTADLASSVCITLPVSVDGTLASLRGDAPPATCAFSGDSLTSLDLSDPALFIDNTAIAADQSAATSVYADLRCSDVTLSATTDFTTKEKSDFLPTKTVAQASAQVVIAADATPADATYALTSDSGVLDHAGTAPGTHSEDVTYNGETVSQSLSRVGDGVLVYNCGGNSKQDIVYTKTLTLPCATQALSHTRSSKVQFTGTQADLSGVANQAESVAETDHFNNGATAMTPFSVTSAAIQHLGAAGPKVTCTAPADFTCAVGDFVAGQGFEISASYTGAHDNIAPGGDNIDVSGTFNLAYDYNGQCTPATESDSFDFDVTITPDPNKFRGKITVQDLSNDQNGDDVPHQTEDETPSSAHIGPMTIETRLKLNDDETEPKPQYRIVFSADSDTTQQTDYRVKWDDTKVEETTIATPPDNPSVPTGRSGTTGKVITLGPGGAGNVVLTLKADADSTVDLNAEAAAFTVTITDGAGNTREIEISIINLEPEAKLELTDCENNSQHEMADGTGPTTVCSDKCCYGTGYQGFKSVSFDLLTLPKTGDGNVANLEAEILDPTGQGDIVVPGSKIQILGTDSNAGTKTNVTLQTTSDCKGMGQFSIKLHNNVGDDTTHVVKFPCRRHADITNIQKSVVLDYGLVYSASPATLTFDADPAGSSSVIYAGAALTCANGAKGGAASCDSDAGTLLKGSNNVADIRELANKFDSCGSWNSAAHTGSMDIVRQYTDGSINYCQENVLTISVLNTGQASATVTAGAFGDAQVAYSVSKLEYSADGCPAGEFKYLYELAGTITSSASLAGDSHSLSIADSTISNAAISLAGDSTVELVKAESACRAVCTDSNLLISDAVTHTFTVVVDVYGEQIHADVQAVLTLGGSPCDAAVQDDLADDVSIGFSMEASNTCPDRGSSAGSYSTAADQTVNLDQYICATISGASSYTLSLTAFSFSASAGPGKSGTAIADFFYGGFGTLEAGETISVTADWSYDVTTGNRRMLRTTYLLGSSSGEAQASIQVISAEVQVQEQIEAAPSLDVILNKTDVPDHEHSFGNAGLIVGCSIAGLSLLWIMVTGFVRRSRGGDFFGVGVKKEQEYRRVGRFQSNLAF